MSATDLFHERILKPFIVRGCSIREMSIGIGEKPRTVKKWLAGIYKSRGITNGCKNVKLAVQMYRETKYEKGKDDRPMVPPGLPYAYFLRTVLPRVSRNIH